MRKELSLASMNCSKGFEKNLRGQAIWKYSMSLLRGCNKI